MTSNNFTLFFSISVSAFLILISSCSTKAKSTGVTSRPEDIGHGINIIGGTPVVKGEFPWLVSVMLNNSRGQVQHMCGGALIDPNYVVTAAHCVVWFYASELVVLAGAHALNVAEPTQQFRNVAHLKIHENYNTSTMRNDIAILRVATPFQENASVNRVAFPPNDHQARGNCVVAGWGITEPGSEYASETLLKGNLSIVTKSVCTDIYSTLFDPTTQICAGGEIIDACTGDSGGPLICNDLNRPYFAGIISTGHYCAVRGYPGVYTEISKYIPWILSP